MTDLPSVFRQAGSYHGLHQSPFCHAQSFTGGHANVIHHLDSNCHSDSSLMAQKSFSQPSKNNPKLNINGIALGLWQNLP
jgi:hypothetical protein